MDNGVRRFVADLTNGGDEREVAYTFVRREYAFEQIPEEDMDRAALYPQELFIISIILSRREFIEQPPFLS